MVGPRCSAGGDAKWEEEARGDQRLLVYMFMKHDEAGQDSASVEIERLGPFRNGDVVGTSNSENPTALDQQHQVRPRRRPGPLNDPNVPERQASGIAKERHCFGQCVWRLRESRSKR